jgi:hypothetical protein
MPMHSESQKFQGIDRRRIHTASKSWIKNQTIHGKQALLTLTVWCLIFLNNKILVVVHFHFTRGKILEK